MFLFFLEFLCIVAAANGREVSILAVKVLDSTIRFLDSFCTNMYASRDLSTSTGISVHTYCPVNMSDHECKNF
jgi:hypothetical protein